MNDKIQDTSGRVSARRRLIKGAFSAPAIMTLYSGSVFATTSSAARCIKNKVTGTTPEFPASPAAATWLRVQRYKLLKTGTTSTYYYYVKGADVVALQQGKFTPLYLGTGDYQKVTGTTTVTIVGASPTSGTNTLEKDTGNFVAVRVDQDGKIVGIVGSGATTSTSAVAQTCWASFAISP